MSRSDENDERVWSACLAEPDWQAELKENDSIVLNQILDERERQFENAQYFDRRLTIDDHVFLHELKINPLE